MQEMISDGSADKGVAGHSQMKQQLLAGNLAVRPERTSGFRHYKTRQT